MIIGQKKTQKVTTRQSRNQRTLYRRLSVGRIGGPKISPRTTTITRRKRKKSTEDRKDHEDNPFDVDGRRLVPPLHSRNARSASDQGTGLVEELCAKCLGSECELRNIHETFSEKGIHRIALKDGNSL